MGDSKEVLIKVFTTRECGFCRVVKSYLQALNVEFEEVDLNENPETVDWLKENIGQIGVPITLFNESDFVLGWQRDQIDAYLKQFKLIK